MRPWQGKIQPCKVALEVSPAADAMGWLLRNGPIILPPLPETIRKSANNSQEPPVPIPNDAITMAPNQVDMVENMPESSVNEHIGADENQVDPVHDMENASSPLSVDKPTDLNSMVHVDNGETAGSSQLIQDGKNMALVPYVAKEVPQNPSSKFFPSIGQRRQSVAGGSLFVVDNRVLEMGSDILRQFTTGSMILNRFDPFQRLPKGPLRSRARSVDVRHPLSVIHEESS